MHDEGAAMAGYPIDVDVVTDRQCEPPGVPLEVVRDLVLRRERAAGQGESRTRQAGLAGGCEQDE